MLTLCYFQWHRLHRGFQRIKAGPKKGGYYHHSFRRDNPDACRFMVRAPKGRKNKSKNITPQNSLTRLCKELDRWDDPLLLVGTGSVAIPKKNQHLWDAAGVEVPSLASLPGTLTSLIAEASYPSLIKETEYELALPSISARSSADSTQTLSDSRSSSSCGKNGSCEAMEGGPRLAAARDFLSTHLLDAISFENSHNVRQANERELECHSRSCQPAPGTEKVDGGTQPVGVSRSVRFDLWGLSSVPATSEGRVPDFFDIDSVFVS